MEWTPEAKKLFKEIPFFVRFAAKRKIENFARDRNEEVISADVYQAAREQFDTKK
ncbi:MAG: protochlorophyllide oxidoreductase [Cyanophyceae cyanobacterium]